MGRKKKWKLSYHNGTMLGFHLTLNPQPPLPPSTNIYRSFLEHGIVISDLELQSILHGRDEGFQTINGILGNTTAPTLGPHLSLELANILTDALLDKSLRGQLSREIPTDIDRWDQRDAVLQHVFPPDNSGFLPQLLQKLPPFGVGFSLTIYFGS